MVQRNGKRRKIFSDCLEYVKSYYRYVCDRIKWKEGGGEKIYVEKEKSGDSYELFVFDMSEMNQSSEVKETLEYLNLEFRRQICYINCRLFIILTYTYIRIDYLLAHKQKIFKFIFGIIEGK